MTITATPGTVGKRKAARRRVRNWLGTSSDPAPRLRSVLLAATSLNYLLKLTTGRAYELRLLRGTELITIDQAITEIDQQTEETNTA
jgi:hypothetical protein